MTLGSKPNTSKCQFSTTEAFFDGQRTGPTEGPLAGVSISFPRVTSFHLIKKDKIAEASNRDASFSYNKRDLVVSAFECLVSFVV